jgi:hypothetical protein
MGCAAELKPSRAGAAMLPMTLAHFRLEKSLLELSLEKNARDKSQQFI